MCLNSDQKFCKNLQYLLYSEVIFSMVVEKKKTNQKIVFAESLRVYFQKCDRFGIYRAL